MAFNREGFAPGEQVIHCRFVFHINLWQLFEEKLQVAARVEAVFFGCLHQTVDDGAGGRAFRGEGEEPVFAPDNERFDGTFAAIIVDF